MEGSTPVAEMASVMPARASLRPVEVEVINFFVQFSQALGQPRSIGEIYGLLFISYAPLSLDDIIARLDMSRGSGSQGLNYLQDLGAVQTVYVPGQRRIHYKAVAELRNLAGRFLRQQMLTHFHDSAERLERIHAEARKLSDAEREHALMRVKVLRSWQKNAKRVLPLVLRILGGGK
jgi:DNA-binding transcriptional regulator GbsR (MarR family)